MGRPYRRRIKAVSYTHLDVYKRQGLFTESCQIAVRSDNDIKSVTDLNGKTVSIGEEEAGTAHNSRQILTSYAVSYTHLDVYKRQLYEPYACIKRSV